MASSDFEWVLVALSSSKWLRVASSGFNLNGFEWL
jgi:hypothetical protein